MTDLSPEEQRRDDGSEIFKQWCGNSYEWDALTNLERERWRRLALSHAREKEELSMHKEQLKRDLASDSVVASCNCLTRSPDIQYHAVGCKYRLTSERDELKRDNDACEGVISFLLEQNKELEAKLTSEISLTKRQHGTIGKCNVKMDELKRRVEELERTLETVESPEIMCDNCGASCGTVMLTASTGDLHVRISSLEAALKVASGALDWYFTYMPSETTAFSIAERTRKSIISRLTGAPKEG